MGRPGALAAALALILAALLVFTAFVIAQPLPDAHPAGVNPLATPGAIGAVARPAVPPPSPVSFALPAPDPAGPDTPGITSLVSAWSPAATTTIRGGDIASNFVYVVDPTGFAVGDTVVFGVTIATAKIASIDGNDIQLVNPLSATVPIGSSMVRSVASPSSQPAISGSGRYVAYASTATTIVPGVGDGYSHIYEFDRTTGIRRLISAATIDTPGGPQQVPFGSQAIEPSVSADGSVIAYVLAIPSQFSAAVVPGASIVVVHDNATGSDMELALGSHPSISGSGGLVAIETTAALDPTRDSNKVSDIYVINRTTGTASLASVAANGHAPAAASSGPSLAANGRSVAFTSAARLLGADHDPAGDIYVRDLAGARTTLVSVHSGPDTGASSGASISGDGRYVAFSSRGLRLASGPAAAAAGAFADVYLRDLTAKATVRLSRAAGGGAADGSSSGAGISADGRTIAFASTADDLVPADTNLGPDVFLADRLTGRITRASIDSGGHEAGPASSAPVLSQDGSILAFQSSAQNLAPGAHGSTDVYVRVRIPGASVTPAVLSFPPRTVGTASPPELVTVRSTGAGPLTVATIALTGANAAAFAIANDGCTGAIMEHGGTCTIAIKFRPAVAGASVASLVITDNDPTGSQTVSLDGGTLKPTIVLDPPIGPPGFVTTAIGTNFPAGATVTLTWSVGLTASMPPVVADSGGNFSVSVLILPRDTLGPRILDGTFTAAGGGSAQSPPFLVVPGRGQPPFAAPRIPGQPPEQIFRR